MPVGSSGAPGRHLSTGFTRSCCCSCVPDAGEQGLVPWRWGLPAGDGRELTAQLQLALPVQGWGTGLSVMPCSCGAGVERLELLKSSFL